MLNAITLGLCTIYLTVIERETEEFVIVKTSFHGKAGYSNSIHLLFICGVCTALTGSTISLR